MSSAGEDPHQLHLHYHDLHKTDCNQARLSPSSVNPNPNLTAQKNPSPNRDELQLRQMKLPLKLPQRRKFITLAEANSASFGLNFHANLENLASLGSSAFQKALDLATAESQEEASKQVELPAMAESKEEAVYEAGERMNTKKKLLAQLAESPGAIVDSQKIESRFHRSSNPSRTCRFCGREFPSGRALGGHMRVHGALLFADTSPYMVEQEQRNHGELETLGSADQMDPHLSRRRQVEEMKPSSFTSSSNSSHMNSERPNQTIKLDRHGQEDGEEEEQDEGKGEKVTRMVNLSSFECTSLLSKPCELLGYGDASSELLTGKRKPASALYELRHNPKPNQRFLRDQERRSLSNGIWHISSAAGGAVSRSRSPSPEGERACSECGKVFLSWKALFGHMRCHPERDWRGIQPPEQQQQLDRTLRSVAPRASYAEISFAENTSTHCELAGSVLSHVDNKGKTTAKLQQDASLKNKALDALTSVVAAPRETESSLTQKGGVCVNIDPRHFRDAATKIDQGEDNITRGPASKKAECTSKKNNTKRTVEHVDHPASRGATTTWSPSWCTGKRSKRGRSAHSHYEVSLTSETTSNELRLSQHDAQLDVQEDLDMANCLVLLANAGDDIQEIDRMCRDRTEGSAFSHHVKKRGNLSKGIYSQRASRAGMGAIQAQMEVHEHDYDNVDDDNAYDEVEKKAATCSVGAEAENHGSFNTEVKYQCSTCKKYFNCHQALGGHRASHKKMKGCFAQTKKFAKEAQESSEENGPEDDFDIEHIRWQAMAQGEGQQEDERPDVCVDPILKASPKKKIKGHECSICHRIFASGQALGGHKRCHWNGERYVADTASVASSNNQQASLEERSEWVSKSIKKLAKEDAIDLNLPAPLDEDAEAATYEHVPTQGAGGRLLPKTGAKEEQAVSSMMDYSGAARRKQHNVQEDWIVKDLLGGGPGSSFFRESTREIEARCRFDRRPPMWNQKWDNVVTTQIPQVCSLKTI